MVRINRTYSIEQNIVEKLKEESNASELINGLLDTYFNRANSKDLQHLKKELDFLENEIGAQRRERDKKADVIRSLEDTAEENTKLILQNEKEKKKTKNNYNWLADQVKAKIITFEEFRNIKNLDNWEDCVEAVKAGNLDIIELTTKSIPREELD